MTDYSIISLLYINYSVSSSIVDKRKKGKLWEFLLDLLMSEETNPSIIKWEDQSKGIFRILDCSHVAYLWGKRKSNPSMTYEKLSRALR